MFPRYKFYKKYYTFCLEKWIIVDNLLTYPLNSAVATRERDFNTLR